MDFTVFHIIFSAITGVGTIYSIYHAARADNVKEVNDMHEKMDRIERHSHDINAKLTIKVINHEKDIAVLKEKLENEIYNTGKALDKILDKLDKLK